MTQTANTRRRFSGTLNFPEPVKRGETALRRADIDWEVQATKLSDLTGKVGGERWTAAVRTDTDEMIGVNGRRHNVIQNSALAELGDAIVQMNDGFAYVGGGSMYGGSKTFLVLSSDKVFHFGQDDDTGTQSVLLVNDFDGNCPIQGIGFVGRYNCMNQMNGLLRRKTGHRLVSVSHTANHTWKLEAAKDTLRALAHEMDDLEVEIQRLLAFELQRGDAALVAAGPAPKADHRSRSTDDGLPHRVHPAVQPAPRRHGTRCGDGSPGHRRAHVQECRPRDSSHQPGYRRQLPDDASGPHRRLLKGRRRAGRQ